MTHRFHMMLVAAAAALVTGPAVAETPPVRQVTTAQATVELITGLSRLSTASELWIGLRFQLQDKWHIYWRNPGDSGGPPTVTWHLPHGVAASDIVWPMPSVCPSVC